MLLSDLWAWPGASPGHAEKDRQLQAVCLRIAGELDRLRECKSMHPLELGFLSFPGKIRCTGDQVVLRLNGVDGDIHVDDPDAVIHFHGAQVRMGGDLYVYDTQRVIGFNSTVGMAPTRYSKDLYSQDGNALTNWAACHIGGMSYGMSSGAPFTLPPGTYGSVFVGYRGHYSGNIWYDVSGDVTFAGANSLGYAVEIQRRRLTSANGAYLGLNGYNLTVTNAGLIMVGEFTDPIWWNRIEAEGSTITTDGDINIGPGGYFTGDSNTVIRLAGNWDNRSQWQSNAFTLAESTLAMTGVTLPETPQLLEAQSVDMGATSAGMTNNHALGRLEIGTPSQAAHVRLVDVDDFREDGQPDALYVGELFMHAGSTLDICGFNPYVDGVSVYGRWLMYGPGRVTDCSIPLGSGNAPIRMREISAVCRIIRPRESRWISLCRPKTMRTCRAGTVSNRKTPGSPSSSGSSSAIASVISRILSERG